MEVEELEEVAVVGEEEDVEYGEILEEDLRQTTSALEDIAHRTSDCSALVAALAQKVESKELSTEKGISFLELKNHLLLRYLLGLGGVVLSKVMGKSIKDSECVDQLIDLRVVMEKIKPIDHKLKYQIDKLIRSASDKKPEADPLAYRANLDNLNEDEDSDTEEHDKVRAAAARQTRKDVYQPPKIASQPYDDEETPVKQMEKARKKSINRTLIRELQEEFLETPTEVFNRGDGFSGQVSRDAQDKQRYEETYMTRLPETKKEKHLQRGVSTIGLLGDEITDFRPKKRVSGKKPAAKGKSKKLKSSKSKKFRKK